MTVDISNSVTVFKSLLGIFSSVVIALSALLTLFLVSPRITLISITGLLSLYYILSRLVNKRLSFYGAQVVDFSLGRMTIIRESISGIREIILYKLREYSLGRFMKYENRVWFPSRHARISCCQSPRPLVESMILMSFVVSTLVLIRGGYSFQNLIPSLATLLFAFQRIAPYAQQIYSSWSIIKASL